MFGKAAESLGEDRRLLVMGDIHGQFGKMLKVLELASYDQAKDRLILLGDYVDRGHESSLVVAEVMRLVETGAVALYGNHEDMMQKALKHRKNGPVSADELEQWYANGGEITLASYRDRSGLLDGHLEFLSKLPSWHEENDYQFVHAGFRPGIPLMLQSLHDMIWIREPYILGYEDSHCVVTGHTPTQYLARYELFSDIEDSSKPVIRKHKIFLDTGAAWGGPLTIMELPSQKYWQA